ncbi:hypothetical protein [Bradyrhizobium genosp. SA-3]|nr:hypothetical protein [Bradyrhizobium genosp. SA-3]
MSEASAFARRGARKSHSNVMKYQGFSAKKNSQFAAERTGIPAQKERY